MYSKKEKLSLLFEMIEFAKNGNAIKSEDFQFIVAVAVQLKVKQEEVEKLLKEKPEVRVLKSEFQRILQFHRLLLLMNIDQDYSDEEILKIKNFGLHLGLRPEATDQILNDMDKYPNKIIPPEEILSIFGRFHN